MTRLRLLPTILVVFLVLSSPVLAQSSETVSLGGSNVVVLKPAQAPVASVILMPGGNGQINAGPNGQVGNLRGNQLVRTRESYRGRGLAVMITDADTNLTAAVEYMARIKRPVTVIATSRGTQRAARGIAAGARPDALVLTSGFLSGGSGAGVHVANIMGSPAALPRTLVIHHRKDGCYLTRPEGVEPFLRWAGDKARVAWIDGPAGSGDPCEAGGAHGFAGQDAQVVGLAAAFR